MLDPTKNNWILPVDGTEPRTENDYERYLEDERIKTFINWETTPTFYAMYRKHIVEYFESLSMKQLLICCRRLNIQIGHGFDKQTYANVLIAHFRELTHGPF